jgi:CheY-like chemotaxis protein
MHIIVCSKTSALVEAASRAFEFGRPRITVCESGLEVLGAVGVVDADLLILDLQTPGLSGLFIISAIQELAPNLPVLAVSATPQEDARAFSHKGVSYATLPSDAQWDGQALMATLAQAGGTRGISSGAGSR